MLWLFKYLNNARCTFAILNALLCTYTFGTSTYSVNIIVFPKFYEEAGDDLITIYLEFNTVTRQQRTLTRLSNFYILLELHDCLLFVVITHHTYVNNKYVPAT
jgi:hypothetical protein